MGEVEVKVFGSKRALVEIGDFFELIQKISVNPQDFCDVGFINRGIGPKFC
jgi:hypothetical protein